MVLVYHKCMNQRHMQLNLITELFKTSLLKHCPYRACVCVCVCECSSSSAPLPTPNICLYFKSCDLEERQRKVGDLTPTVPLSNQQDVSEELPWKAETLCCS